MPAASVTAYLSPTIARKRAISSGESGGALGWRIFMADLCACLLFFLFRMHLASPRHPCATAFAFVAGGASRPCGEPRRKRVRDAVILRGSQELAPQDDDYAIVIPGPRRRGAAEPCA